MKVIFVRHGKTKGNLEKRYIGKTDEDLSLEGIKEIKINIDKKLYPPADILFVSPMRRCIQTADLIYPKIKREIINNFRECDFGIFEGKNYIELIGCNEYQKWIDSNGVLPFPEGESREGFSDRCSEAFIQTIRNNYNDEITVAYIVHGGTIMSILDKFTNENKSYYDFQCKNSYGYICEVYINNDNLVFSRISSISEEIS